MGVGSKYSILMMYAPGKNEHCDSPRQKGKHQRNFHHKVKTNGSVDRFLPSKHENFIDRHDQKESSRDSQSKTLLWYPCCNSGESDCA